MKTTMDRAGRLVIPKEIREGAQLTPGEPLEIQLRDGRVEIQPQPRRVQVRPKGKLAVAVAPDQAESLTVEMVREIQQMLRER